MFVSDLFSRERGIRENKSPRKFPCRYTVHWSRMVQFAVRENKSPRKCTFAFFPCGSAFLGSGEVVFTFVTRIWTHLSFVPSQGTGCTRCVVAIWMLSGGTVHYNKHTWKSRKQVRVTKTPLHPTFI